VIALGFVSAILADLALEEVLARRILRLLEEHRLQNYA
jgi:hypothetical protein